MSTEPNQTDTIGDAFRASVAECIKASKAFSDFAKWLAKRFKTDIIANLKKRARQYPDIHRRRFHRNPKRRALRK